MPLEREDGRCVPRACGARRWCALAPLLVRVRLPFRPTRANERRTPAAPAPRTKFNESSRPSVVHSPPNPSAWPLHSELVLPRSLFGASRSAAGLGQSLAAFKSITPGRRRRPLLASVSQPPTGGSHAPPLADHSKATPSAVGVSSPALVRSPVGRASALQPRQPIATSPGELTDGRCESGARCRCKDPPCGERLTRCHAITAFVLGRSFGAG